MGVPGLSSWCEDKKRVPQSNVILVPKLPSPTKPDITKWPIIIIDFDNFQFMVPSLIKYTTFFHKYEGYPESSDSIDIDISLDSFFDRICRFLASFVLTEHRLILSFDGPAQVKSKSSTRNGRYASSSARSRHLFRSPVNPIDPLSSLSSKKKQLLPLFQNLYSSIVASVFQVQSDWVNQWPKEHSLGDPDWPTPIKLIQSVGENDHHSGMLCFQLPAKYMFTNDSDSFLFETHQDTHIVPSRSLRFSSSNIQIPKHLPKTSLFNAFQNSRPPCIHFSSISPHNLVFHSLHVKPTSFLILLPSVHGCDHTGASKSASSFPETIKTCRKIIRWYSIFIFTNYRLSYRIFKTRKSTSSKRSIFSELHKLINFHVSYTPSGFSRFKSILFSIPWVFDHFISWFFDFWIPYWKFRYTKPNQLSNDSINPQFLIDYSYPFRYPWETTPRGPPYFSKRIQIATNSILVNYPIILRFYSMRATDWALLDIPHKNLEVRYRLSLLESDNSNSSSSTFKEYSTTMEGPSVKCYRWSSLFQKISLEIKIRDYFLTEIETENPKHLTNENSDVASDIIAHILIYTFSSVPYIWKSNSYAAALFSLNGRHLNGNLPIPIGHPGFPRVRLSSIFAKYGFRDIPKDQDLEFMANPHSKNIEAKLSTNIEEEDPLLLQYTIEDQNFIGSLSDSFITIISALASRLQYVEAGLTCRKLGFMLSPLFLDSSSQDLWPRTISSIETKSTTDCRNHLLPPCIIDSQTGEHIAKTDTRFSKEFLLPTDTIFHGLGNDDFHYFRLSKLATHNLVVSTLLRPYVSLMSSNRFMSLPYPFPSKSKFPNDAKILTPLQGLISFPHYGESKVSLFENSILKSNGISLTKSVLLFHHCLGFHVTPLISKSPSYIQSFIYSSNPWTIFYEISSNIDSDIVFPRILPPAWMSWLSFLSANLGYIANTAITSILPSDISNISKSEEIEMTSTESSTMNDETEISPDRSSSSTSTRSSCTKNENSHFLTFPIFSNIAIDATLLHFSILFMYYCFKHDSYISTSNKSGSGSLESKSSSIISPIEFGCHQLVKSSMEQYHGPILINGIPVDSGTQSPRICLDPSYLTIATVLRKSITVSNQIHGMLFSPLTNFFDEIPPVNVSNETKSNNEIPIKFIPPSACSSDQFAFPWGFDSLLYYSCWVFLHVQHLTKSDNDVIPIASKILSIVGRPIFNMFIALRKSIFRWESLVPSNFTLIQPLQNTRNVRQVSIPNHPSGDPPTVEIPLDLPHSCISTQIFKKFFELSPSVDDLKFNLVRKKYTKQIWPDSESSGCRIQFDSDLSSRLMRYSLIHNIFKHDNSIPPPKRKYSDFLEYSSRLKVQSIDTFYRNFVQKLIDFDNSRDLDLDLPASAHPSIWGTVKNSHVIGIVFRSPAENEEWSRLSYDYSPSMTLCLQMENIPDLDNSSVPGPVVQTSNYFHDFSASLWSKKNLQMEKERLKVSKENGRLTKLEKTEKKKSKELKKLAKRKRREARKATSENQDPNLE